MGKKQYKKPEIKDFISPSLHGDISPMGICSTGYSAGGAGNCELGSGVYEDDPDCADGGRPLGNCSPGSRVTQCYTGTFA